MDPVTLGILGVSVASGLGQYLSSSQARAANKAELQKVQDLYSKVSSPNFDMTQLTPEDYSVVQQYTPQVAQQIKEQAPTLISNTADMQTGRQAQMDALTKLRQVASGAPDADFEAKQQEAGRQSQINAQSSIDSVLQQQARRGMLGGGNQLAAQLQGSSSAMDRAAQVGAQNASTSYQNQLAAVNQSAQLGGQIRSADESKQAQNAGIINAYNARSAAAGQQYQNNYANTLNQGNLYNTQQAQQTANMNTQTANQYQQTNRTALNQLRQNSFADQMNINSGLSGSYQSMGANQIGAGQDRNSAIGGLSNGITAGAMYYGNQKDDTDEYGNYG